MPNRALSLSPSQISEDQALQCAKLSWVTWPKNDTLPQRLARWSQHLQEPANDRMSQLMLHLMLDQERVLALALSFQRIIACSDQRFPILALASVITDPGHRGQGHGRTVVESAFSRHRSLGIPCLFQTGVPQFYERLGATCVNNPIYTSIGDRAFWEPHAMRYPATTAWPTGTIDLLGPGW